MTVDAAPEARPHASLVRTPAEVALDYARRMSERQRRMLPPVGFNVDWADQPSRHKLYLDAPRSPLPPPGDATAGVPLQVAIGRAAGWGAGVAVDTPMSLDDLAEVLAVNALSNRQTVLNWNDDARVRLTTGSDGWSRPTASGGGMYPVETYVVSDGSGAVPRGVHHYDTAHHALETISTADRTDQLARATGVHTPLALVGAVRLWKNSFKYNSFCYHVVTQDSGALLASWRTVLGAQGRPVTPVLWFDQSATAAVIEVDPAEETPVLVVPLVPSAAVGASSDGRDGTSVHGLPTWPAAPLPRVRERSSRPRRFPLVDEVVAATHVGDESAPATPPGLPDLPTSGPDASEGTSGTVPLPAPAGGPADVRQCLLERHSAFGLMTGAIPVPLTALAEVLASVSSMTMTGTDLAPSRADVREPWVRLWAVVRNVDGVAPGGYAYDPAAHTLVRVGDADLAALQPSYALQNYSTAQAGAMLVLSCDLPGLVRACGAPGYRFAGVEVGQAAQAAYLAASDQRLAIGAVLGVDNLAVNDMLGLDLDSEQSMLFLFLGVERTARARYDHRVPRRGHPTDEGGAS
jgi:SagB-type dehydrogenase family enzyme